eukprot:SAG11_NODE_456_length_9319_cov_5.131128_3_plen_155_part_00
MGRVLGWPGAQPLPLRDRPERLARKFCGECVRGCGRERVASFGFPQSGKTCCYDHKQPGMVSLRPMWAARDGFWALEHSPVFKIKSYQEQWYESLNRLVVDNIRDRCAAAMPEPTVSTEVQRQEVDNKLQAWMPPLVPHTGQALPLMGSGCRVG